MQVIKRDGRIVEFEPERVTNAICKAMNECGVNTSMASTITEQILEQMKDKDTWSVDAIQNLVENQLMASNMPDVARAYIIYRNKRDIVRNGKSNAIIADIIAAKKNDITRENANMNADTPAGMMMKIASERSKEFTDGFLLSECASQLVSDGILHIHDKDYYPSKSLTCVQSPVDKLLSDGFLAGHGESRPAKRIETASILTCISMETTQNEQHGGQSIPAFDFYLAPFVRKTYIEEVEKLEAVIGDDYSRIKNEPVDEYEFVPLDKLYGLPRVKQQAINMTVNRVHQSMEAFIHNMNTIHSRGGNQVVFSSINYGTDTSAEGRCIIRELLNSTYRGVGNGETAIFPIQIWKKKRGVSYLPTDRNYDLYQLACKVTARRFFPNFLNLDATFNQSEEWKADDPKRYLHEVATMGCRTRVYENRFGPKTSVGRGNLSFSTINIVRLAIECMEIKNLDERIALFFAKLDSLLDITARQLHERMEFQKSAFAKQFPLLMSALWVGCDKLKAGDTIAPVINQGTLGIGFIGLAECLVALTGKHHGESQEAQELGVRIITYMRDRANDFSEQYQHNYSILATPAEGLSGRFTRGDRKRFGVLPGITDRDYYTNSNHVPVYYKCSARHKAEIEAPYHDLTRGGHIFYVEMDGDATHNPEAIMKVVDMMDQYNIGYGSVNHNRNRCLDCGFENSTKNLEECPKCGSKNLDKLQRITGYLVGTTDRWNKAKLSELNDRVIHE